MGYRMLTADQYAALGTLRLSATRDMEVPRQDKRQAIHLRP